VIDLLKSAVQRVGGLDQESMRACRLRQDGLTKPIGSLGVLEDIAVRIAGITGDPRPAPGRKTVLVMAADHGVVSEGVSLYPPDVTAQMVMNFLSGGAAINVLAGHAGANVVVVDIGVASTLEHANLVSRKVRPGTADMAAGPAMAADEAVGAVEVGIEVALGVIRGGSQYLAVGDMGIGNTTAASAITACMTGLDPLEVTGRGTGVDDGTLEHKVEVIRRALEINRPDPGNPLDVLSKVGGLEIAGIAGAIIACAAERRPVLLDGFISSTGALIAAGLCPRSVDFMIASHLSVEKGHRAVLDELGLHPVIHANMRLGEGTGAALAFLIVDASLKLLREMATFEDAGVSGPAGEGE
jgi:nicotinate-nucleotide--dimethylbenzimidazole phosphoribosyltransferase